MKTETQEVRSSQNLMLRKWIIRVCIFCLAGCSLIFLVSLATEMGLTAKGKVELPGLNLEVSNGQTEQLSSSQVSEVISDASNPSAQAFNTQYVGNSNYCQYDYDYFSFAIDPNDWYLASPYGYYVATDGYSSFFVLNPYGYVSSIPFENNAQWIYAEDGIEVCSDSQGTYARYG